MSCSLSSEPRPTVCQSPLLSVEYAPILDSADAGHLLLVDAFDSAVPPVLCQWKKLKMRKVLWI